MSILRLSHVEIRVPDLELATAYYTEVVGMYETARESDRVFLKCWDEHQHHSIVLKYAPTHGLEHFGFDSDDLDADIAHGHLGTGNGAEQHQLVEIAEMTDTEELAGHLRQSGAEREIAEVTELIAISAGSLWKSLGALMRTDKQR